MQQTTSAPSLKYITQQTATECDACIIWLHGLGADGYDFAGIVSELQLPPHVRWRFIFPHAPLRPVTINGGADMRAWYDIFNLSDLSHEDKVGIIQSQALIIELIEQQRQNGISSQRIILAGFSQGGALALYCGLRYPERLGGILALSTYLPLLSALKTEAAPDNQATSIMQSHGHFDKVLPYALGEHTYHALLTLGYPITWHAYPMAHQVCAQEIIDINQWLLNRLETTLPVDKLGNLKK